MTETVAGPVIDAAKAEVAAGAGIVEDAGTTEGIEADRHRPRSGGPRTIANGITDRSRAAKRAQPQRKRPFLA